MNLLFYLTTVLIWGSTWLAIKFQLGTVDPMVSVACRFGLASALLLGFCLLTGRSLRFPLRRHLSVAMQGLLLFCLNYWLFYVAEMTLTSGVVAVAFSFLVVMNPLNAALFLKTAIERRIIAGALAGLCGILLVFWPEFTQLGSAAGLRGLGLCLLATLLASFGNILSAYNQKHNMPVVQGNALGMGYGSLFMALLAVAGGKAFVLPMTVAYLGSLAYLSIFGSIIAFGCYLSLVGRIGAGRAAYATLLFPLVALGLSTLFEGYRWRPEALIGLLLILAGNLLVLIRPAPATQPAVSGPVLAETGQA